MLLFSTVIDRLPSYPFDDQAVKVMVAFLVERSADYICEAECIYGLWALFTHHEELTATHLHVIFRTLFKITISSQLRKTRLETYVIIKESLQRHFDRSFLIIFTKWNIMDFNIGFRSKIRSI